ncbi:MAG: hypothetical protein FH749_03055 [Firmicutes bacterium]|nr:hypothetical protein [Bacillota bacterium]
MAAKKRLTAFFGGVLAGILISLVIMTGLVYLGSKQAVVVRINTNLLADTLEGSAQYLVESSIPIYLDDVKGNVPDVIGSRVEQQFDDAQLTMGGVSFSLPQEFVYQLETNYQESLVQSLNELLDTMPVEALSDELGEEISGAVINSLYSEFNHKIFEFEFLWGLITLPVQIELIDIPGEDDVKLIFAPNGI